MKKLTPLRDTVVVQQHAAPGVSAGGIIFPDASQEKPLQGRVVAVGPGRRKDNDELTKMYVKVDDEVVFKPHHGTKFSINGVELLLLEHESIIARID